MTLTRHVPAPILTTKSSPPCCAKCGAMMLFSCGDRYGNRGLHLRVPLRGHSGRRRAIRFNIRLTVAALGLLRLRHDAEAELARLTLLRPLGPARAWLTATDFSSPDRAANFFCSSS